MQDDVSAKIAGALHQAFSRTDPPPIDATVYDLFARARPKSYAPDDLRTCVQLLEVVADRAPDFLDAWGRLAYLRGFLHVYLPFGERAANARRVALEASRALAQDPESIDALAAHCFVAPPFGDFLDADRYLERLQRAPGAGDGPRHVGWFLRHTGRVRESVEATERAWRLDPLDPMSVNLMALALMASGRVDEAVPLYEALVERIPAMSFPSPACCARARSSRTGTPSTGCSRSRGPGHCASSRTRPPSSRPSAIPLRRTSTRGTRRCRRTWRRAAGSTSRVSSTPRTWAGSTTRIGWPKAPGSAPRATPTTWMGPDGYRTALLFQASMPELRNDPRFPRLAARLGLVEFWIVSGSGPIARARCLTTSLGACEAARNVAREPFTFHAGACRGSAARDGSRRTARSAARGGSQTNV